MAGVYLGYDQPRSLGGYAQGGRIAAPMVKQLIQQTLPRWSRLPAVAPADVHMVKIDRVTGKRVFAGEPGNDPKIVADLGGLQGRYRAQALDPDR